MVLQERFCFESLSHSSGHSAQNDPFLKEVWCKWGLEHHTRLISFRFRRDGTDNSAHSHTLTSLRTNGFHKGLLDEFLCALFGAECVLHAMGIKSPHTSLVSKKDVVFEELRTTWISLEPFQRLLTKGVTRWVESDAEDAFDGARFPIVALPEVFLPHEVSVSDRLRALFLLAHNNAVCGAEDDTYEDMYGAKLALGEHKEIFTRDERRECLYHCMWRLVAGGGHMNQWEDNFAVYLTATRELYKRLVAIRTTRQCGDVEEMGVANGDSAALVPEVVSVGVQVQSVRGLELFPRSDEAEPSNLNYCYVFIDPLASEVTVWYHHF